MQIQSRFAGPLLVFAVLLMASLAAGCGSNPLVGKWSEDNPRGVPNYTQFNSDGTWSSSIPDERVEISGTYKTKNDTLTMSQTSYVVSGVKLIKTSLVVAPQVMTYQVNGNTLTVSNKGQEFHFTREK